MMASGPEHYREAERFLAILDVEHDPEAWAKAGADGSVTHALQVAQAHATLALAAAVAMGMGTTQPGTLDEAAWYEAAGTRPVPVPGVTP